MRKTLTLACWLLVTWVLETPTEMVTWTPMVWICYSQGRVKLPPAPPPPQKKIPLMNSKIESWIHGSCRFVIHLRLHSFMMSYTSEVVMKFLPAQSSWIWCKSMSSKLFCPFKNISIWPNTEKSSWRRFVCLKCSRCFIRNVWTIGQITRRKVLRLHYAQVMR